MRTHCSFAIIVAAWLGCSEPAFADGAFGDSQTILLPRTNPHRIIASMTDAAGLVVSDDDGASWYWICESGLGVYASLFQLGPQPDEVLFSVAQSGLVVSSDNGCSWQNPGGIVKRAGDVFADPSDSQRVLAIAQTTIADEQVFSDVVVESLDAGRSFGAPLFTTSTASITGVEIARSDPASIFLTLSGLQLQQPYIVRSTDRGASWTTINLSRQLGQKPTIMRILMIASDDARSLYLRLSDGNADALGISHDGGDTVRVALQLSSSMSAFLLRSDGALIVAAADASSYISTDGAASFEAWSSSFHVRALAERDGAIYASANARLDGFSLAVSRDAGANWQPLLRLRDLRGPLSCGDIPRLCADSWTQLAPALPALSGEPIATETQPLTAAAPPKRALEVRGGGCSVAAYSVLDHGDLIAAAYLACMAALVRRRSRAKRASS